MRIKWFRPFPEPELRAVLSRFKAVGIIDRDYSLGSPSNGGVLYNEVRSALYDADTRVPVVGYIAGLGGREVTVPMTTEMFDYTQKVADTGIIEEPLRWIGVRD